MQFRQIKRIKQALDYAQCQQVLYSGKYGTLAVLGDGGYPYAVPLNYVYDGQYIYIHCAKQGHKSDAIKNCDKVSFCVVQKDDVVPQKLTTYYVSAIAFGRAEITEDTNEIIAATKKLGLKYCSDTAFIDGEINNYLKSLSCIKITIEHLSGKMANELIPPLS